MMISTIYINNLYLQQLVCGLVLHEAVLDLGLCHELLHGVDGGADAGDGEEGGEVGGVAADHQHHEHPPGGHHHPPGHGPEHWH